MCFVVVYTTPLLSVSLLSSFVPPSLLPFYPLRIYQRGGEKRAELASVDAVSFGTWDCGSGDSAGQLPAFCPACNSCSPRELLANTNAVLDRSDHAQPVRLTHIRMFIHLS